MVVVSERRWLVLQYGGIKRVQNSIFVGIKLQFMASSSQLLYRSYLALLAGVLFTGMSAVVIKMANAPGVVTTFYRMGIGAVVLFIPFVMYWRKHGTLHKRGVVFAILSGLCFGVDLALWSTAIMDTDTTLPTLAANLAPVWTGLGAMWLFKEHPRRGFWMGLVIALLGILVMIAPDLHGNTVVLRSILFGLMAGMLYGIYYLTAQEGRTQMDTLPFLFISTFTSAVVLLVATLFTGDALVGYPNHTWVIFVFNGVVVHVVGWWLINFAQGYLRATVVAPTLLGQPIVTVIAAWFILDERHSLWHIAGGVIVLGGIYLVHWARRKG